MRGNDVPREVLDDAFVHLTTFNDALACAKACRNWYLSAIQALYKLDAGRQRHAIQYAIATDTQETLERILSSSAYPLHFGELSPAIAHGRKRLVRAMLNSPTVLQQWRESSSGQDSRGRVPLSVAAAIRDMTTVRDILQIERVKHSGEDKRLGSPLVAACRAGSEDTENVLEDYKISELGILSGQAPSPTLQSIDKYQIRIDRPMIQTLLDAGAHPNGQWAVLPLHLAVKAEDAEVANLLLDRGADVNGRMHGGYTPMAVATRAGSMGMIKLLTDRGADWSLKTAKESSLLHLVESTDVAGYLLSAGADLEAVRRTTHWWPGVQARVTPLMRACECGREEIAKLFLDAGADPHVSNQGGYTTLHAAACRGLVNTVQLLHDRGVDLETKSTQKRWTALDSAASLDHVEVVAKLLELGAKAHLQREGVNALRLAKSEQVVRLLVRCGADINMVNGWDLTTLLHKVSRKVPFGATEMGLVAVYLELGVNLSQVDKQGNTALHTAAMHGSHVAIETLLAAGADANQPGEGGQTPLVMVCRRSSLSLVRAMLAGEGLQAQRPSLAIDPALRVALSRGNANVVHELLKAGGDPGMVRRQANKRMGNKLAALGSGRTVS